LGLGKRFFLVAQWEFELNQSGIETVIDEATYARPLTRFELNQSGIETF